MITVDKIERGNKQRNNFFFFLNDNDKVKNVKEYINYFTFIAIFAKTFKLFFRTFRSTRASTSKFVTLVCPDWVSTLYQII